VRARVAGGGARMRPRGMPGRSDGEMGILRLRGPGDSGLSKANTGLHADWLRVAVDRKLQDTVSKDAAGAMRLFGWDRGGGVRVRERGGIGGGDSGKMRRKDDECLQQKQRSGRRTSERRKRWVDRERVRESRARGGGGEKRIRKTSKTLKRAGRI
jgi:hypothetical protein